MWRTRGRINFSTWGHLLLKVSSKIWAISGFQRFSGTSFTPRENSCNTPFPAAISKSYLSAAYKMHYSNESKKILFCLSSLSNGFECPGFLFAAYFHTSASRYSCTVVSWDWFYLHEPHNKVFIRTICWCGQLQRGKSLVNNFCDADGRRVFFSISYFKTYSTSRK